MSDLQQYDLAVIGGGLAGLSLAIDCARKGLTVILFEKEKYPFHKVCGEYISMESWNFLTSIGVHLASLNLPLITRFQSSDVSGKLYDFPLDLGGFGISRFLLDELLFNIAIQHNVQVHTATRVNNVTFEEDRFTITSNEHSYYARTVAGSFGKRSNLDVRLRRSFIQKKPSAINNFIGVKYHIRYPQPQGLISLHNFKDGYCGISAIEDDKCCLCYLTTAHNLRKSDNSISQMERDVLGKNPVLKQIFCNATFLYPEPLTISSVSFDPKTQVENHMLMLGDAAGMIPPLCGNGMSMALHSAKLVSQLLLLFIHEKLSRTELEQQYESVWKAAFSKRLITGRIVQRLFGGNRTTALFLGVMKKTPPLAAKIISLTHGKPF